MVISASKGKAGRGRVRAEGLQFAGHTELWDTGAPEPQGGGRQRSRVWLVGAREGHGVEVRGVGSALEAPEKGGFAFYSEHGESHLGFEQGVMTLASF